MEVWELTIVLAELEKRIIELIKQGTSSTNKTSKNIRNRRNILRELLLSKLKLMQEGKLQEHIGYAKAIEFDERRIEEEVF